MTAVSIIGSGFSSLSAACYLAKAGFKVDVFEKGNTIGGRASIYRHKGFTFDMGPSWYWMPDVFDRFFNDFNKKPSDYYTLSRLSPAYRVYYEDQSHLDIADNFNTICEMFEAIEVGSSLQLKRYMRKAADNYKIAVENLVYKPGVSALELITPDTIKKANLFFKSIRHDVRKYFKHPKLVNILEFPVLFLGAKPQNTPAFYNFMNYADFVLGTWYPDGGMYKVVTGMQKLAEELGVTFHLNSRVDRIIVEKNRARGITVNNTNHLASYVLSGADYHHSESLLAKKHQTYSESYWAKKTFAPSALLFYVAFDKKLKGLQHHTLFFDKALDPHAYTIYDKPSWPTEPLFYASFPSITDNSVAPEGKEAGTFLIPLAPGLEDNESIRETYFEHIVMRLENMTKQNVGEHIIFKKSYCVNDFKTDYNSYQGNAYGLANTLMQTAFLRPKIISKKVSHLFFTGQLTVPGPGVPPAIISGKIAAEEVIKLQTKNRRYEKVI